MPNESNRRNLRAQMELISDFHTDITVKAASINASLLKADEAEDMESALICKFANRKFGELSLLLKEQGERLVRVRAECNTIKENVKII